MPHDLRNRVLQVGDLVMIPCRITSIIPTAGYCNLSVETLLDMPPDNTKTHIYELNTKQVLRANVLDNYGLKFSVNSEGKTIFVGA